AGQGDPGRRSRCAGCVLARFLQPVEYGALGSHVLVEPAVCRRRPAARLVAWPGDRRRLVGLGAGTDRMGRDPVQAPPQTTREATAPARLMAVAADVSSTAR